MEGGKDIFPTPVILVEQQCRGGPCLCPGESQTPGCPGSPEKVKYIQSAKLLLLPSKW